MAYPSNTVTTQLVLSGIALSPYATRGLKMTMEPIDQASQLERSINGELINFGSDRFQKFKVQISGDDQRPPALDDRWPGDDVTVDAIVRMGVNGAAVHATTGITITEGSYSFVRYQLVCKIVNFSIEGDEWQAGVAWKLDLLEV